MAEQIRKQPAPARQEENVVDAPELSAEAKLAATALKAEMDDLLDEIDDVLEVNAEDFVKAYVQKGGE